MREQPGIHARSCVRPAITEDLAVNRVDLAHKGRYDGCRRIRHERRDRDGQNRRRGGFGDGMQVGTGDVGADNATTRAGRSLRRGGRPNTADYDRERGKGSHADVGKQWLSHHCSLRIQPHARKAHRRARQETDARATLLRPRSARRPHDCPARHHSGTGWEEPSDACHGSSAGSRGIVGILVANPQQPTVGSDRGSGLRHLTKISVPSDEGRRPIGQDVDGLGRRHVSTSPGASQSDRCRRRSPSRQRDRRCAAAQAACRSDRRRPGRSPAWGMSAAADRWPFAAATSYRRSASWSPHSTPAETAA